MAKNWCYTLNNYTPAEYEALAGTLPTDVVYLVCGKETGASGTPHLQGFISLSKRKRLTQVRRLSDRAHWEMARDARAAADYCKKDGDFVELGDPTAIAKQGKRNDLESFKESVRNGMVDRKELREAHSLVCARFPRFVEQYLRDVRGPPPLELHPLRPWQQELVDYIAEPVDPRAIVFVVDEAGGAGKSYIAAYCETQTTHIVQVMKPGKLADMAFAYDETNEVFILDCPRSKQGDFVQYDFLENVKDGRLFSPKYESVTKRFVPPHVIVFMNEFPDMNKLSADRYKFIDVN